LVAGTDTVPGFQTSEQSSGTHRPSSGKNEVNLGAGDDFVGPREVGAQFRHVQGHFNHWWYSRM